MPLRTDMGAREYLDVFLRRKWFVIFAVMGTYLAASIYCIVVPNQYKSETMIMLVPQSVPEHYVRPTATLRIEDRMNIIRQQVISRTRLERVIQELDLYPNDRKEGSMDEIVEMIRKRISVQIAGRDLFALSFIHEDPETAMRATSLMTSLFIEENLKTREQQSVETADFFQTQLEQTKEKLEAQEERIKKYKMENAGELPYQLQTNLTTLTRVQDQLHANQSMLRVAEDRKYSLEAQLESAGGTMTTTANVGGGPEHAAVQDPAHPFAVELASKRTALSNLQMKYTDQYPDIQRLKRETEQLESRIKAARQSTAAAGNAVNQSATSPSLDPVIESPEDRRLRAQILSAKQEIASLKEEAARIQKKIDESQAKVDQTPEREQEMLALTRDYENLKRSYDDLKQKKIDADIAKNLELRQKGEQFQILDPANIPESPVLPNPLKVYLLSTLLALMIGFGGAIGAEMMDTTLKDSKEFRSFNKLPILAGIAMIQDRVMERRRKIQKAVLLGGILSIMVALTIYLVMYSEQIKKVLHA